MSSTAPPSFPQSPYRDPPRSLVHDMMSGLIHTDLGSSSLIAHVLHSPPPPPANSFIIGPAVINTHTPLPYSYYDYDSWSIEHGDLVQNVEDDFDSNYEP